MGLYGYAVQIYCDFSGYTDIAIGVALLRVPASRRTSTAVLAPRRSGLLAALAHARCRAGCATTCTSRSAGAGAGRRGRYRNCPHHVARRPVARGGVDVRRLGRAARLLAGVQDDRGRIGETTAAGRPPGQPAGAPVRRGVTLNLRHAAWVFFRATTFDGVPDPRGHGWWSRPRPVTPGILLAIAIGIGAQYVPGTSSSGYRRVSRAGLRRPRAWRSLSPWWSSTPWAARASPAFIYFQF